MHPDNAPRCLMFYPWYLDHHSGALAVFQAYCRAFVDAGFRLDCYAPRKSLSSPVDDASSFGFFENLFLPPAADSPLTSFLGTVARLSSDRELPDRGGCDDNAIVSAAILAAIRPYDVVGVHYTRCHTVAALLPPGVRRILFTHDLDAEVALQESAAWGRPVPRYTLADEIARIRQFDVVTVLGPDDLQAIQRLAPGQTVIESPMVFDTHPREETDGAANRLLWISSISNFHRVSFEWFWQHVWPRLTSAQPRTALIVAGDICQAARALGVTSDPRVELVGPAANLGTLYDRADIAVAPYYYGGGQKIKVIEALAYGVPVVTTFRGLSNTRLMAGRDLLVADDASSFARHVLDLMASPDRRRRLSEAGQAYIRREHNPGTSLNGLRTAALELARRPGAASRMAVTPDIDSALSLLAPWVVDRCKSAGLNRVAFFGAGSHTRALLRHWTARAGPSVLTIVTSWPGALASLDGIPVVAVSSFDPESVDGVVLSSREFEAEMAETCARRWPGLPVVPVWRPLSSIRPPRGTDPDLPMSTGRRWCESIPDNRPSAVAH
jgi:glycosyltransferase involved in cell wall biosynthesis